MIIKQVKAQKMYNAQGIPTIQCLIILENNQTISGTISSEFEDQKFSILHHDQAKSIHEQTEHAIMFINNTIAPMFEKQELNALAMDSKLMDLESTSNITLAISIALFKAQAVAEGIEVYAFLQSISGSKEAVIPTPIVSMLEGRTAYSQKNILEFLCIPQTDNTEKNLAAISLFHQHLQKVLTLKKHPLTTTSAGSFAPALFMIEEYFNILQETMQTIPDYQYSLGLNIQACAIYDLKTKTYLWNNQAIISDDLINAYKKLIDSHNISYLQDALSSQDIEGWSTIKKQLPNHLVLSADSLFCSKPMHIRKGVLQQITPYVIIRPEHLGTVSKTIAAIDVCKFNKIPFIVASDLDLTNETFAIDLACATGASFVKSGGFAGFEHIAKYNRLLKIEKSF